MKKVISEDLKEIICPICGKKFKQKRSWQKYCCNKCRKEAYNERHNICVKQELSNLKQEINKIKERLED